MYLKPSTFVFTKLNCIFAKPPYCNTLMKTNVKKELLEDFLRAKKNKSYSVKVTTYLEGERVTTRVKGALKNDFFEDCIKRDFTESQMAKYIFEVYYSLINTQPFLVEKEIPEIKNFLIDRIKP